MSRILQFLSAVAVLATAVVAVPATAQAATCVGTGTTGMQQRTVTVGGQTRTFAVYVPTSWTPASSVPAVYFFHGKYGDATEQLTSSRFPREADKAGFIAVAPQATGTDKDWNTSEHVGVETSDANFLLKVQQSVNATWCVDQARQYAAGYSSGSRMTHALACYGFGGFAGFGGTAYTHWDSWCPNTGGFNFVYFHGTADPYVPFWGNGADVQSVQESFYSMAATDGCSTTEPNWISSAASTTTRFTWTACAGGHSIDVYVGEGAGHVWPGSTDYSTQLGPRPEGFDFAPTLVKAWGLAA